MSLTVLPYGYTRNHMNRRRKSYLEKGKALLAAGKKTDAYDCFQKCVNVSPEMALAFIKVAQTPPSLDQFAAWYICYWMMTFIM